METCIAAFSPARCMWGSNFPVDKGSYGYGVRLNAFERILSPASMREQEDVLWPNAQRSYRMTMPVAPAKVPQLSNWSFAS
nr:amidohydrolase family protein [Variovorax paradoxus]